MPTSPIAASRPTPSAPGVNDPVRAAAAIGEKIAGPSAGSVDRESRFPSEGIDALRDAKLLSALVPASYGGLGCSITQVSTMCDALGQYCASTATVFAMHQIQVACIVRHGQSSPFFRDYLRELVDRQVLIASATSEVSVGGDVRSSVCTVERDG